MALKLLPQSGDYKTETREWFKLPEYKKIWAVWKTTFQVDYVEKRCAEAAWEGEEKSFGVSYIFGAAPEKKANEQLRRQEYQKTAGPAPLTNQMMDLLEGYLDNISVVATQTVANGGPLTELAASLEISVDTVARHKQ